MAAAILQGVDGVSVTFFVHAAKVEARRSNFLSRLRQNP
jgi:hypothetical protein